MDKDLSLYKKLFEKNGYKFTTQKRIVLLEIINANTHLTVNEIYDKIRNRNIGLATIYRSLKLFNELDIIKQINIDNVSYYEMKIFSGKPLHIHFKCSKCGHKIQTTNDDSGFLCQQPMPFRTSGICAGSYDVEISEAEFNAR